MSKRRTLAVFASIAIFAGWCDAARAQAPNQAGNTFNVALAPYSADTTGVNDDTAAIQQAVNDAIAYGNANGNTPVTVLLPAGTYLIANGPLSIQNSTNLTFTGAGAGSTMLWYTRANPGSLHIWYNTNVTVENFSGDVQKLPSTGQYDLGETQGTITAINAAAKQVTVQVESGYPLLNRPDLENVLNNGYATANWSKYLYTLPDPTRYDFDQNSLDGNINGMSSIAPSPSGATAVITLGSINSAMYVGEKWMIWIGGNGPNFLDLGFGDYGATLIQNINFYGGALNYAMGNTGNSTGTITLNNFYGGPPPYQSDRMLTCDEGWQGGTRAAFTATDSTFLKTWDDTFDLGTGETTALSSSGNQVLIYGTGDYKQGDTVEFGDNTNQPKGTYGLSQITQVAQTNGNTLLTLSQGVTIHDPGTDRCCDLTQAGPITATNCTFSCSDSRHVYFQSGVSTTVTGCTFEYNTPLVLGGFDAGGTTSAAEAPSDVHNVTITGNTFLDAAGVIIQGNGDFDKNDPYATNHDTAPCGSNVIVTGNRFLNCGHYVLSCGRFGPLVSGPLTIHNVTGVTVTNNWFDNNWGVNAAFQYDANVAVTGNTFLHPNELPGFNPVDASVVNSVVNLADVSGGVLSGNVVYGAGPGTDLLAEAGQNVSGVTGLSDGITDLDNPLALYLPYDGLVAARPASGSVLAQAAWTGAKGQTWQALPTQTLAPALAGPPAGLFTLSDTGNGKYADNGSTTAAGSTVSEQAQSWTGGVPSTGQLWALGLIDNGTNNVLNDFINDVLNVIGGGSNAGAQICQWYAGSAQNQNWEVIQAPAASATTQFGTVTVSWTPVPYATGYSVGRATKSGGPYTTLASGLTVGPYTDASITPGTTYYYVVTAAGLPISNNVSNQVYATPGGTYTPVNLAPAFNVTGIEPNGWVYQSLGFDGQGYAYPSALTGSSITWDGARFPLGPPAQPDAVADAGQRIYLPWGSYTSLLLLGGYLGTGPSSTGTFTPTLAYESGLRVALSQGMTNWCGTAGQPGESNATTYSYRDDGNGSRQSQTCYIHGYSIPIDPTQGVAWLDLPDTGSFRLLGVALGGLSRSTLEAGQSLVPGQYLVSPNGQYILVQQADGHLALYAGSSPQHEKGAPLWQSTLTNPTGGPYFTVLQSDGNLVTYPGTPAGPTAPAPAAAPVWASGTSSDAVTSLVLTNTPEVQLLYGTAVVWQTP